MRRFLSPVLNNHKCTVVRCSTRGSIHRDMWCLRFQHFQANWSKLCGFVLDYVLI